MVDLFNGAVDQDSLFEVTPLEDFPADVSFDLTATGGACCNCCGCCCDVEPAAER
ncbi:MAG: hypothetical protein AAF604_13035 [Acidobacteriota bacterium]